MKTITMILMVYSVFLMTETRIDGVYYRSNSSDPNTFEFKNNKLVVQTDSILHFGFQYTSYYDIENINDSIFEIHFIKQYFQDNNHPKMNRRKKFKNGRSFLFQIDKFKYWSFEKITDGSFSLKGYALKENKYMEKLEIPLVTTKPKLD